jgi:hypothetical protein
MNFLRSIHWNVYFSGPEAKPHKVPIVKEFEKGFLILVKWLDSSPEDLVTRILKTLCYHGTREANSVIYAPHPECRLTYNKFRFEPNQGKILTVPATKDCYPVTYLASKVAFGITTAQNIASSEYVNHNSDSYNFGESDIEKQMAYTYWTEHFPEENPDKLWEKFSPAAIDAALAKTQILNPDITAAGKCYPHNVFELHDTKTNAATHPNNAKKKAAAKKPQNQPEKRAAMDALPNNETEKNVMETAGAKKRKTKQPKVLDVKESSDSA